MRGGRVRLGGSGGREGPRLGHCVRTPGGDVGGRVVLAEDVGERGGRLLASTLSFCDEGRLGGGRNWEVWKMQDCPGRVC